MLFPYDGFFVHFRWIKPVRRFFLWLGRFINGGLWKFDANAINRWFLVTIDSTFGLFEFYDNYFRNLLFRAYIIYLQPTAESTNKKKTNCEPTIPPRHHKITQTHARGMKNLRTRSTIFSRWKLSLCNARACAIITTRPPIASQYQFTYWPPRVSPIFLIGPPPLSLSLSRCNKDNNETRVLPVHARS